MARDMENAKRLQREWYLRNKEKTKERARQWALANPEKAAEAKTKWRQENIEKHNTTNRNWWSKNKDKRAAYEAKRRATLLQRTPKWLTTNQIRVMQAFYEIAAMLSRENNEPWHVDHIIPLQGKNVSGLHVPSNLRVIPGSENVQKSNKYTI